MGLKSTEELFAMKMKNAAKCAEKLICHFKTDMKNLMNFDPSTCKSLLLYILFKLKIWRGIDLLFKSWHKEFDKFSP